MQQWDMEVVANMTDTDLITEIRNARPDKKDTMRAEDIWKKKPYSSYDRTQLANRQLKAITDTAKFYRRAKAFLLKEIDISLCNTIFYKCNTISARQFIDGTITMVKEERKTLEALDSL